MVYWAVQFIAIGSFLAILALIWRVSARPRWQIRAVIYGWGLVLAWSLLWSVVFPLLLRGVMDSSTLAKTFPEGTIVMASLFCGWFWPLVVVGARKLALKRGNTNGQ